MASERCELLEDTIIIIVPGAQYNSATESPQGTAGIYTAYSQFACKGTRKQVITK